MQLYTVYLCLQIALHVSGGTFTHHHEHVQLYLQHLILIKRLQLLACIAAISCNGFISIRCCRYNCTCSWWWVKVPPETYGAIFRHKYTVYSCILLDNYWICTYDARTHKQNFHVHVPKHNNYGSWFQASAAKQMRIAHF